MNSVIKKTMIDINNYLLENNVSDKEFFRIIFSNLKSNDIKATKTIYYFINIINDENKINCKK